MRRALLALLFSLWSTLASAGVNCSLPFTLTNGTTADASQVMANYNAIISCLASAASAGSNTDITALLGLTTPLNQASGGTPWFVGGTSTGSANAQVVTPLTPSNFTLTRGFFAVFIAGFTNTGPTTLTVNGTTATNVVVHTASGNSPLAGGEIVATQVTIAFFDGTQYQLIAAAPTALVQPCTEIDYQGVAVPSGYLVENGAAVSRTTFSNLFSCLAYTSVAATTSSGSNSVVVPNAFLFQIGWFVGGNNVTCNSTITNIPDGTHINISPNATGNGATTLTIGPQPQGDCSTTFNLPNMQGRMSVSTDPAGTTMSSTACPNPASVGSRCGTTTETIAVTNLPTFTPSGTISVSQNANINNGGVAVAANAPFTVSTAVAATITATFTGNPIGSTTPFLLQPVQVVQKAIKF